MPFELEIGEVLKSEGWKIKIRLKERNEHLHVTVMKKTKVWRINLRDFTFVDDIAPMKELPSFIKGIIRENICLLRSEWDDLYGDVNPVNTACPVGESCQVCNGTR